MIPPSRREAAPKARRGVRAVGIAMLMALVACESSVSAPATREARLADVAAHIGTAECNADSQCRTIGVGSKPCGGFDRYLAWSTLRSDGESLRRAAEEQTIREQKARSTAADPMLSNCQMVTDPGAYCAAPVASGAASAGADRVCRLRSGGVGGASSLR